MVLSVLLAALAVAAVAVYGSLRPSGGTDWRVAGTIIVERESGARFVYLEGKLHPVLNYASALLIVGGTVTAGAGLWRLARRAGMRTAFVSDVAEE